MSSTSSVNEHNVIKHLPFASIGSVSYRITRNSSGVLAITLLEQIDGTDLLTTAELTKVADVYAELLDGTGTESVGSYYEHAKLVLEEEIGDLAEVGGLSNAVDSDDADDIGACVRRLDRACDISEKVER